MLGLGETQRQLLSALAAAPGGMSVDELASKLGVTITAVRQHLTALERDALVTRGPTRASGGRPQHMFVLTERGREGFPRQYSWFSEQLLLSLKREMGSAKLEKTLRILGDEAGAAVAAPTNAPPEARARILAQRMGELGYDAHVVERDGKLEVSARNCVFHKLAAKHPEVCSFDLGLIERIAGARVDHDQCIIRGGGECRFRLRARR